MNKIHSQVIIATLSMLCASPMLTLAQTPSDRTTEEPSPIPSCSNGGVYSTVTKTCTDPISTRSNLVSQANTNAIPSAAPGTFDNKAYDRTDTTGRNSVIADDTSSTVQDNASTSKATDHHPAKHKSHAKKTRPHAKKTNGNPGENQDNTTGSGTGASTTTPGNSSSTTTNPTGATATPSATSTSSSSGATTGNASSGSVGGGSSGTTQESSSGTGAR
ncbi:MAG: hypothetical protein V4525_12580 [Pseudomonadota bacterium]